jgi:hypothetical protein
MPRFLFIFLTYNKNTGFIFKKYIIPPIFSLDALQYKI